MRKRSARSKNQHLDDRLFPTPCPYRARGEGKKNGRRGEDTPLDQHTNDRLIRHDQTAQRHTAPSDWKQ